MMAFVLTRKAREDLLSIGRYTEEQVGKKPTQSLLNNAG
jgi:plasmid stabilization system protein ParE